MAQPDWDLGACVGTDPELFFPGPGSAAISLPAKRICGLCRIRGECLEYAIEAGEDHGVWGGLSQNERRAEIRRRNRNGRVPQRVALVQHRVKLAHNYRKAGLRPGEIAAALRVTVQTVDTYLKTAVA